MNNLAIIGLCILCIVIIVIIVIILLNNKSTNEVFSFVHIVDEETLERRLRVTTASNTELRINWGDGTSETYSGSKIDLIHVYKSSGTYTVNVTTSNITGIFFTVYNDTTETKSKNMILANDIDLSHNLSDNLLRSKLEDQPFSLTLNIDVEVLNVISELPSIQNLSIGSPSLNKITNIGRLFGIDLLLIGNNSYDILTIIKEFKKLTKVNLSNKGYAGSFDVTRLPPTITSLVIRSNTITDIVNLDYLQNLDLFACDDNLLTSLNLSNNPEIKFLYAYNNQITSLDLSNLPKLEVLYMLQNELQTLDLSANPLIATLFANNNIIETVTLPNNNILSYINLEFNNLDQTNADAIGTQLLAGSETGDIIIAVQNNDVFIDIGVSPWTELADKGWVIN